jgi:uncharacterized membrane protein (UPF0127 family)
VPSESFDLPEGQPDVLSGSKLDGERKGQGLSKRNQVRFVNSSRKTVLADRAVCARSIFSRFKGLLGTRELPDGCGLLLDPCNGIHMFWMTYAIDAIFVDRDYKVVGLVSNIKPWQVSKVFRNARACLELPTGTIEKSSTQLGDVLNFESLPD